ncbi:THO complex subunit 5 homolog [Ctenocephalides felis]|uniref:THO complex subunit 5 homolog n=1 Tax=Ctenocephalides felis TaxID=7515 RepID=UPI000E6E1918|nr:THO complex subunit 5 homolog [Ctenocephalides felis]
MVKDSETVIKKRRKSSTTTTVADKTISSEELYNRVINYEEEEAKLRSPESDAKLFYKTCNELRAIFAEILELKSKTDADVSKEIADKRIQASMLFLVLKKLNRMEKYRTKAGRDLLHKEKQNVDSTQLQLQNLFYESDHLNKEVTKCLQFKSKDEEIDLISPEEFFKSAPESILKDVTIEDPHKLQLARLEYELMQRKELARMCKELQDKKEVIAAEIVAKRTQLNSLSPQLKTMLEATKPLQEALGLPIDKEKQMQARAKLLPEPLYLLYVNVYAYNQVCDKLISLSINGDDDDARQYIESHDICGNDLELESESEIDNENTEEKQTKKRHHRKITKGDLLEQKRKELLKPHPLSVVMVISTKDDFKMSLTFSYLKMLHIVTVSCEVKCSENSDLFSSSDLIAPMSILNCLYKNDNGETSPNLTNSYKLQKLGLGDLIPLLGDLGRPYIWAQKLCGMDFLLVDLQKETKYDISHSVVQSVVKTLRSRLSARIDLCKQIQKLESGVLYEVPDADVFISSKYTCSLTQWLRISWPEYCGSQSTKLHIQEQNVFETDIFYRALITKGSAKLECFVAVSVDYPKITPIFSLTVTCNGDIMDNTNYDTIRDMERAINCDCEKQVAPHNSRYILTLQLIRVLSCFDIFLENHTSFEQNKGKSPNTFVRGRNRLQAYKFEPAVNGMFSHF